MRAFLTHEVMNHQSTLSKYKPQLELLTPFTNKDEATKLWEDFALRIVEHVRLIQYNLPF